MNLVIANTIRNQISKNGFMCWGSRNFLGSNNEENTKGYKIENGLGYLQFTASNNPKISQAIQVKIVLDFDDTYSVKFFTKKRFTQKMKTDWIKSGVYPDLVNVIKEEKGVYCDQLEDVIFSVLG